MQPTQEVGQDSVEPLCVSPSLPTPKTCLLKVGPPTNLLSPVIESVPPHPDSVHLQFARGWLELGNIQEAETELGNIRPQYFGCPDVLEIRFQVLARRQCYIEGLAIAKQHVADFPTDFRGHMNQANALFWLNRPQEAIDSVMDILPQHPKIAALPYNLACYWMKLGDAAQAVHWLESAMQIGLRKGVIQHALSDPDLRPIWDYIRELEESGDGD